MTNYGIFFFSSRRRHTRWTGDWSSDVCSSDLANELAKELDVIRREMDMNQDDPGRRASRRLFETAYTRSPYRFTVIGYPDIFNQLKPEDIVSYYRERYAPNNVFFVVVGDVKASEVLEQIRAAYANKKAQALPPMVLPEEPTQTAPREI